MFFGLPNHKTVSSKVAPYHKLVCINEKVSGYGTGLNGLYHYGGIYNTIYYAMRYIHEQNDYQRTYFYTKKNLIKYHDSNGAPLFIIDIIHEKDNIFGLENTEYVNMDDNSILVSTEQGKRYLISNDLKYEGKREHVSIIDITTGKVVYMKKYYLHDDVYLKSIYPIGNSVIPVINFKEEYIAVFFSIYWIIKSVMYHGF